MARMMNKRRVMGGLTALAAVLLVGCTHPGSGCDIDSNKQFDIAEIFTEDLTVKNPHVTEGGHPVTNWMDYLKEVASQP